MLKLTLLYKDSKWAAPALYEAAQAFEQLKKPDDAGKLYRRCVKQYPDTESAARARQRLKALASKRRSSATED